MQRISLWPFGLVTTGLRLSRLSVCAGTSPAESRCRLCAGGQCLGAWWSSCGRALGRTDCPQWVLWPLALPPWKAQSSGHSQGLHGSSDLPSPVNITLSDRVNVFLLQGRHFSSPGSSFCADFFWYPFHPHVTAVARKISRSFCQKCRWQVTAKHAYILRRWLNCMKWHGA